MKILKKSSLLLCLILLIGGKLHAQEKGDIGLLFSAPTNRGVALEYRKMAGEKYRLRMGLTYSQDNNNQYLYPQIISASDSLVTTRANLNKQYNIGLRFGALNQLRSSIFSLGVDVGLNYRNETRGYYDAFVRPDSSSGAWITDYTSAFPPYENPSGTYITRHYLVPNIRFVLNADVPLGKSLLIHFEIAPTIELPIYMGLGPYQIPPGEVVGLPANIFQANYQSAIGLRYIIGSR